MTCVVVYTLSYCCRFLLFQVCVCVCSLLLVLFISHAMLRLEQDVVVQAYLRKVAQQISAANQLSGMLGVFQKLIASRALDHEGFNLLDSMMQYVPFAGLQQYMPQVSKAMLEAVHCMGQHFMSKMVFLAPSHPRDLHLLD